MYPLQIPGALELLVLVVLLALPVVLVSVALVVYAVYVRDDAGEGEQAAAADPPRE